MDDIEKKVNLIVEYTALDNPEDKAKVKRILAESEKAKKKRRFLKGKNSCI